MLYAKLNSPSTYTPLLGHPIWEEALEALRSLNTDSPLGITELRGKDMFVNVHTYETKPLAECRFEGHRDMIDIQYIISGGELVDWHLKSELVEDGAYDAKKDFQFYLEPDGPILTRIHLEAGHFGVFFAEDGHRPQIHDGVSQGVLKVVVKINKKLLTVGQRQF